MNLCEIGLFHIVFGVSKGTRDNYHEIGENNILCPKYIDIYEFWGVREGGVHIPPYIFCKNQILHHFDLIFFFLGWIVKILRKGGPRVPLSYFFTK